MTKRTVVAGAVVAAGVVFACRRGCRGCRHADVETRIERLPEGSPRKWMFRNISAIRQNTERILELVGTES